MCLVAVRAVVVGVQVSESGKSGSDVNLGCEDCTEGRMRTCTTYLMWSTYLLEEPVGE